MTIETTGWTHKCHQVEVQWLRDGPWEAIFFTEPSDDVNEDKEMLLDLLQNGYDQGRGVFHVFGARLVKIRERTQFETTVVLES